MNLYERLSKENQAKIENFEFPTLKKHLMKSLTEKKYYVELTIQEWMSLCDTLRLKNYDLDQNLHLWKK